MTNRVLACAWWTFTLIAVFGMFLQHVSVGAAVTATGVSGLVFTACAFLLNVRDQADD